MTFHVARREGENSKGGEVAASSGVAFFRQLFS